MNRRIVGGASESSVRLFVGGPVAARRAGLRLMVSALLLLAAPVAFAQNLTFHNTLGSLAEVNNSVVGPPLVLQTTPDAYGGTPCTPQFGTGINSGALALGPAQPPYSVDPGSRNRLYNLTSSVANPDRGTIEVVFKMLTSPGGYGPYQYINLFDGPYGYEPGIRLFVGDSLYDGTTRVHFALDPTTSAHSLVDGLNGFDITGQLNVWITLTAVWDRNGVAGSNHTMRIYVDGQLSAASTIGGWISAWYYPNVKIGGCTGGGGVGQYYIDDIKVRDAALEPFSNLVFRNSLGSQNEAANSVVGPPLGVSCVPNFGPGFDGGAVTPGNCTDVFSLPSVIDVEHGCIESVFRLTAAPGSASGFDFVHLLGAPSSVSPGMEFVVADHHWSDTTRVVFRIDDQATAGQNAVFAISNTDGLHGADITGTLNSWIHAAAVWDRSGIEGSADTVRLYINNQLRATSTRSDWVATVGPTFDVAGCAGNGNGKYYIDDLKIWTIPTTSFTLEYAFRMDSAGGPGSAVISNNFGRPTDVVFNAFSFDPANAGSGLGTGWFAGLFVGFYDLAAQWSFQAPPFVYMLDATGSAASYYPSGSLAPFSGATVYALAVCIDSITGALRCTSGPLEYTVP